MSESVDNVLNISDIVDRPNIDWLYKSYKLGGAEYKYLVNFLVWETCDGEYMGYTLEYTYLKLPDPIWYGAIVTGIRLLKALGLEFVEYVSNRHGSAMYVLQTIYMSTLEYDDDEDCEYDEYAEDLDLQPSTGFDLDIPIQQDSELIKLLVDCINVECADGFVFRNYSSTICYDKSNQKEWEIIIQGINDGLTIRQILLAINPDIYNISKNNRFGGDNLSYPLRVTSVY